MRKAIMASASSYASRRLRCLVVALTFATLFIASGCSHGGGGGGGLGSNPVPTATLTASNMSVAAGGSTVLTATCTNSTSAVASGGWSDTLSAAGGTATKNPTVTTTYTLTCNGAGGTATASVIVTVVAPPAPTIAANPGIITLGQSTVITWNAGGTATSDSVSGSSGSGLTTSTALTGTATATPTATATYTISATNAGGTTTQSVTVTVNAAPPTATLSCTPTSITLGSSVSCAIATTNATTVTASSTDGSWSGTVPTNGTVTVTPKSITGTVTYSITATGSGGSVTATSGTITVVNTAIQLTSVNQPVTFCVGQCGFLTLTFTGANLATGEVPSCTPNCNILSAQVLNSTQVSVTFGIDQVHEGSGWRSFKICTSDGTGCSATVAFGLYSQDMCASATSGEMFCLNPEEVVAGQTANGDVDKFKSDGTPDGKFAVPGYSCCIAVDNVTGYVIVDKYVYSQNGIGAAPHPQGFQPEPVVANAAGNGVVCVLQPDAPNNLTCSNIAGPATSWPPPVASTNVGTNPQSLAIAVSGGKTYVDVLTSSTPTLWSVDTSTMATITSQPLTGVTANLPGGSAITVFDSLGTGLITSFGDNVAIPFSETTLKQGTAIKLPGVPVSAVASTPNGIMVVGNADQPNAGGTLTEVNPTTGVATLVPSVETLVMPVGTVPATTGKGFFVCPQDGKSPCTSYTLP